VRHKFELLLKDFWRALKRPAQNENMLRLAVWGFTRFTPELVPDAVKVRQVLEFVEALRSSDTPGRQVAEERLMGDLVHLAGQCSEVLEDAKCPRLTGFDTILAAPGELQPVLRVLKELHDFALACFQFKRPRDSFGGARRALAFGILGRVGWAVDLPEVVPMALRALRKTKSVESRQASEFLQEYFAERDLAPDDAMIEELLSLVESTNSRSTAYGALNALVETGAISEFEAMDRMDNWKSKHR